MKLARYDSDQLDTLVPLLEAIGREIEERHTILRGLEAQARRSAKNGLDQGDDYLNLVAQIATHKRETRLAARELEHLGCSIECKRPLTVHIATKDKRVHVWQPGQGIQALVSLEA